MKKNMYDIEREVLSDYENDIWKALHAAENELRKRGYEPKEIREMINHASDELKERMKGIKSKISPKETRVFHTRVEERFGGKVEALDRENRAAKYVRDKNWFEASPAVYRDVVLGLDKWITEHEKRHREQDRKLEPGMYKNAIKKQEYATMQILDTFGEADSENHALKSVSSKNVGTKELIINYGGLWKVDHLIKNHFLERKQGFKHCKNGMRAEESYVFYTLAPAIYHKLEKDGKTRNEIKNYFKEAFFQDPKGNMRMGKYAASLLEGLHK